MGDMEEVVVRLKYPREGEGEAADRALARELDR